MRSKLKNIQTGDYWVYGLSVGDFDYIFNLTESLIADRNTLLEKRQNNVIKSNPNPDIHSEIISDIGHCSWVETQFLWQFCLTRLQGIFEGLIVFKYLSRSSSSGLPGLKKKLREVKERGYSLSKSEYDELLDWANLRNFLAHAPPEQYRPGSLEKRMYKIINHYL
jgi:hypothetical protein